MYYCHNSLTMDLLGIHLGFVWEWILSNIIYSAIRSMIEIVPLPGRPAGEDARLDATAMAVHLEGLAADAARYAEKASGDGTRRAYGPAWAAYAGWCQRHGPEPLAGDPGIVALYLTAWAKTGLSVSSLGVASAAIRARHRMAKATLDLDDPGVILVMRGIANEKDKRPRGKAAPALPTLLRCMLEFCPLPQSPAGSPRGTGRCC
jgi:hypothetical protein